MTPSRRVPPRPEQGRLTGGRFRGRRFEVPPSLRATEAKVRQALFNILQHVIEGARVVDVFAGSGALGLEALSRGAAYAAFIESDPAAVVAIRDNLAGLAPDVDRDAWRVLHLEAAQGLRTLAETEPPFDLVFCDPPYAGPEAEKALNVVGECAILAPAGLAVLEHPVQTALPEAVGGLRQQRQHRYGDTVLSFYGRPETPAGPSSDRP